MLLKAMSIGMTSEDKTLMKPLLELIVEQYPKTEESERAIELLSIIEKGVSENKEVDFTKKSIYEYNENDSYYLLIFLDEKQNSNNEKGNVVDFDREFFSRLQLKVSSKIFGGSQNVIFVEEFENQETVQDYLSTFKSTRKHITKLHNNNIIIISKKNLKTLFKTQNLSEYESFAIQYF